jgi:hypothetical protein
LYNGGIGLDKGILAIEANSKDNFGNVCLSKECKLRMKLQQKEKLILIGRNQGNQSDSEAFYEYRWKRKKLSN